MILMMLAKALNGLARCVMIDDDGMMARALGAH